MEKPDTAAIANDAEAQRIDLSRIIEAALHNLSLDLTSKDEAAEAVCTEFMGRKIDKAELYELIEKAEKQYTGTCSICKTLNIQHDDGICKAELDDVSEIEGEQTVEVTLALTVTAESCKEAVKYFLDDAADTNMVFTYQIVDAEGRKFDYEHDHEDDDVFDDDDEDDDE